MANLQNMHNMYKNMQENNMQIHMQYVLNNMQNNKQKQDANMQNMPNKMAKKKYAVTTWPSGILITILVCKYAKKNTSGILTPWTKTFENVRTSTS